jgi:hypothetical protein
MLPREGYKLSLPGKRPDDPPSRPLRLVSVGDDYLVCNPIDVDGNPIDVDIYVMKPWTLRRTPFDGTGPDADGISYAYVSNVERIATRGDVSEDQFITPNYNVENDIYVESTTEIFHLSNGKAARLMDANKDGRAWAHLPTQVSPGDLYGGDADVGDVLTWDGSEGVWAAPSGGGGGSLNLDGGDASSVYGGTTAIDGGGA